MNVLERIVQSTRADVERRSRQVSLADLEARLVPNREDRAFSEALVRPGISLIAEHKRASPSAGTIRDGAEVSEIVGAYERAGAAALSVLTEGRHFAGELEDLHEAKRVTRLPVLRKDFIVDPYQVVESAVAGADAILLIVAALEPRDLADLFAIARDVELDVLVEVHDEAELDAALEIDFNVVGINNRDLTDFSVDLERTYDLLNDVPTGKIVVSESGIHSREQLDDLERVGVDAVLIGESLMRADDVESAVRELVGHTDDDV